MVVGRAMMLTIAWSAWLMGLAGLASLFVSPCLTLAG